MSWSKLDDDLVFPEAPYSALLADGLTRNVNSYPTLNGGSSVSWLATGPVTWASYGQSMGTVVTLDVGPNCGEIRFRFAYQTATDNGDGDGLSGRLFVRHLTSNREVSVGITPSTGGSYANLALEFDAVSNYPSGPQAFFVSFQSSVLEIIGTVAVLDGVGNQLTVQPSIEGPFPAGEVYWLLTFEQDDAKNWVEPDALGNYNYQVGWISGDYTEDVATWIIWPGLDDSPAIVSYGSGGANPAGVVRELGAFGLLSFQYEVTAAPARNLRQLAHAPAVSLNSLSLDQSLAVWDIRPDVSANATEDRLGYGLQAGEDISGVVAIQGEATGRISISFRAVRLEDEGSDASWSLKTYKANGSFAAPEVVLTALFIPRYQTQWNVAGGPTTMRVMQGLRRGPRAWGMRDSMPLTDCLKGTPVLIETAEFLLPAVSNLGAMATFRLSVSVGQFYLYGFNARWI